MRGVLLIVALTGLLLPPKVMADRPVEIIEPDTQRGFFQNGIALGVTSALAIGLFVAGGFVLADVDLKMDAVDRGYAGHMTQEEAIDIETRANLQAAGGWILIGLGTGLAISAVSLLVNDIVVYARNDGEPSTDRGFAFGLSPTNEGAVFTLGGGF